MVLKCLKYAHINIDTLVVIVYIYRIKNMVENTNPLSKYYRQPAIYIALPTGKDYYGSDVVQPTETGELPVLPMTAKDELAFKTPDALMNGQATVDVIKSCMPNIIDPWNIVNYDLDTILLAIRIATYGETMDVTTTVPVVNEQITHSINLVALLETIKNIQFKDSVTTKDGFTVKLKPLTYKEITNTQIKTFQQQKQFAGITNSSLSEEEKTQRYAESFKQLNDLNFVMLSDSIISITTPGGEEVTEKTQIIEFLENTQSKRVQEIQEGLMELRNQAALKPIKINTTEEQIKKGAPATFEIPLTFDNANFFV